MENIFNSVNSFIGKMTALFVGLLSFGVMAEILFGSPVLGMSVIANVMEVINLLGDGLTMSPFGQGWASMSAPTKELEKMVLKKPINHLNNPIMRWMMSNVALRTDPSANIKIDKAIGVNENSTSEIKKNNLEIKNLFSKLGIFLLS